MNKILALFACAALLIAPSCLNMCSKKCGSCCQTQESCPDKKADAGTKCGTDGNAECKDKE